MEHSVPLVLILGDFFLMYFVTFDYELFIFLRIVFAGILIGLVGSWIFTVYFYLLLPGTWGYYQ